MSVVTPHQTDLTTSCKFKRDPRLRRALHLLLNPFFGCGRYHVVGGMRIGVPPMTVIGSGLCLLNQASANECSRFGDW